MATLCVSSLLQHEHFVNYTGYCAYEMVFLKQPPSLLDFELDPIYDGLSLPATEYLKLMENRFNLMKKIILDQKVKDQLAQYYRKENIPITTHLLLGIWCI